MVQLIPNNNNPTQNEIDVFIQHEQGDELKCTRREIECKQIVGALLHPSEEYFLEKFKILKT